MRVTVTMCVDLNCRQHRDIKMTVCKRLAPLAFTQNSLSRVKVWSTNTEKFATRLSRATTRIVAPKESTLRIAAARQTRARAGDVTTLSSRRAVR